MGRRSSGRPRRGEPGPAGSEVLSPGRQLLEGREVPDGLQEKKGKCGNKWGCVLGKVSSYGISAFVVNNCPAMTLSRDVQTRVSKELYVLRRKLKKNSQASHKFSGSPLGGRPESAALQRQPPTPQQLL